LLLNAKNTKKKKKGEISLQPTVRVAEYQPETVETMKISRIKVATR
jgi:hypothetical protein